MGRRRFTGGSTRRTRLPGSATGLFKLVGPKLRPAKRLPNARGWAKPGRDAPRTKKPRANRPHKALDDHGLKTVNDRRNTAVRTNQKDFYLLSPDPDDRGFPKRKHREEASTALDMREQGQLPADIRRPTKSGQGDFVGTVDGKEMHYDIKQMRDRWPEGSGRSPNEPFKPSDGGYSSKKFEILMEQQLAPKKNIVDQIAQERTVILDTRTLRQQTIDDMLRVVTDKGWSSRVIWYP